MTMKQRCILLLLIYYQRLCLTRQQSSSVNTMERVICINKIHYRQKPKRPHYNHKRLVYMRLIKGRRFWRCRGGDTDGYLKGPCTLMWKRLGGAEGRGRAVLRCTGPCRHLSHRVNTVKHCTMPLGTDRSRHGPRMKHWGGRRKFTLVLLWV